MSATYWKGFEKFLKHAKELLCSLCFAVGIFSKVDKCLAKLFLHVCQKVLSFSDGNGSVKSKAFHCIAITVTFFTTGARAMMLQFLVVQDLNKQSQATFRFILLGLYGAVTTY